VQYPGCPNPVRSGARSRLHLYCGMLTDRQRWPVANHWGRPMKFSALSVAIAASVFVAPAQAAVVLDQDNFISIVSPGNQFVQGVGRLNNRRQAQNVVAGVTGELTRIDLQVASIGNVGTNKLAIEILHGGVGSLPAGPGPSPFLVAGSSLPDFQVVDQNNFLSLDVSSLNFQTVAGQDFLIYV
jgi:hypothetical protein